MPQPRQQPPPAACLMSAISGPPQGQPTTGAGAGRACDGSAPATRRSLAAGLAADEGPACYVESGLALAVRRDGRQGGAVADAS